MLCILFIAPLCAEQIHNDQGKLRFVIVLTRHGVRSPTESLDQLSQYSAQPWPKWEVPPGDLTPHGAKLMEIFGAYYRSYFAQQGLMNEKGCGDAAHVSVYADSDQRTIETALSLGSGLFPGCPAAARPAPHALSQGQPDPLFHPLAAKVGNPDHERAVAAIAGRIGDDPARVTEAYRRQLEALQRILLGCPPGSACPLPAHSATQSLLAIPASLKPAKGDHLAELKGPLTAASTIAENLLLECTEGMPTDQVGWGRVDDGTLKELLDLHTAASDLSRRTPYIATVQASNLLAHILNTLKQAVEAKQIPGALGKPDDRVVILVGHDTNLANIAGMLNINWIIDGRRDDTPPGGALVFELWEFTGGADYEVRTYYVAQTIDQMRRLAPLTLENPPARAKVFIPNCSQAGEDFPCDWKAFQQTLDSTVDRNFVK